MLDPPQPTHEHAFKEMLQARRSSVGGDIAWSDIEAVLWHSARTVTNDGVGRAGIEIDRRPAPAAGGLHCIHIVCQMCANDGQPRLYLPRHGFAELNHRAGSAALNRAEVVQLLPGAAGCTLRFVADMDKVSAAYNNPESLVWRDSGALAATIGLVAEWLDLSANMLGIAGGEYMRSIGFPGERFLAVGGIQISSRSP
ncbi:hypothetical protein [Mesorhizobium japonicum]|uniref:hypothetical protein n=1 Tax=Mesorhizobium japonicum TaxID=2066070 RepID=UPI0005CB2C4F|nr:hypothetical protein [Mesorhizobium japonicum]